VVALATEAPARRLRYEDPSTLRVGALADIALFRLHEGAFPFYDNTGEIRSLLLRNVRTIVGGRVLAKQAASPRAVWAQHWDRGGTNARIQRHSASWWQRGIRQSRCAVAVQSRPDDKAPQLLAACACTPRFPVTRAKWGAGVRVTGPTPTRGAGVIDWTPFQGHFSPETCLRSGKASRSGA
jgi:hypothetical protein